VSTSQLSGNLIKSLLARDEPDGIRERYGRARNVRALVDDGGTTLELLHRLGMQTKRLRDIIDVNLVQDSTSVVEQLVHNVDSIVRRTADDWNDFGALVFDVMTSAGSCGNTISQTVKNFTEFARLTASLRPTNRQSFNELFIEFIVKEFLAYYNVNCTAEESTLKKAVFDMCGRQSKLAKAVEASTSIILRNDRCNRSSFCSKVLDIIFSNDLASTYLGLELSVLKDPIYCRPDKVAYLIRSLNVSETDQEGINSDRVQLQHNEEELYELLYTPSVFDVQHCAVETDKWLADLVSQPEEINTRRSLSSAVSDAHRLIAVFDREVLWVNTLIVAFEQSNITKVKSIYIYR